MNSGVWCIQWCWEAGSAYFPKELRSIRSSSWRPKHSKQALWSCIISCKDRRRHIPEATFHFRSSRGKKEKNMQVVTSKDGTTIAYDKQGEGPAVILVAGALCTRLGWSGPHLSNLLARSFTVYNYDRRGRGDSGDTKPYAVAREIEDIEALIDEAGGSASLYGHSSGAALALEAALRLGKKVKKLAMYEAPYNDDAEAQRAWKEYIKHLTEALAADRRGDAVALFMQYVGTPADQIEAMRHAP